MISQHIKYNKQVYRILDPRLVYNTLTRDVAELL